MKILELAPYVFVEGHKHGSRNTSGLAYMIRSICDMLAPGNDVRVLTESILTGEQRVSGWVLLRRNLWTILGHFRWRYLRLAFRIWRQDKGLPLIKHLLYCLSAGQAESYIRAWKPDAVQVHIISHYSFAYYLAAARCGAPLVVTLHGLISFSDVTEASPFEKQLERRFIRLCCEEGVSMIFISSGMKARVEQWLGHPCDNISVVPNCFRESVPAESAGKSHTGKRLVCVGSLSELKNQIQVIRILPALQERLGEELTLHIVGAGDRLDEMQELVARNGIQGVTFCGRLPQAGVYAELQEADLLVFPSREEGFGIPMVEAYRCGVPVVTFRDLDAAEDIYNACSTVFAADRSDGALTEAILSALQRNWDADAIREWSRHFSMESIAERYQRELSKAAHRPLDPARLLRIIESSNERV